MKIGIIYCCYGNPEYIDNCLKPWLEAKEKYDIKIATVQGQFLEYHQLNIEDKDDITIGKLEGYKDLKKIDYLYIQNPIYSSKLVYQTESEIRDKGLQWLLKEKCDTILLLDNDEKYTLEQINKIIEYVNKYDNRFYGYFSIPMKNYIFSGKEWISGFCPARIWRTKFPSYMYNLTLNKCNWDNDMEYITDTGKIISDKELANKSIPPNLIENGIKHLTWLNENGEKKVNYQLKHFGACSYKWNKELNKLEFDLDYHKVRNIPLPQINYD